MARTNASLERGIGDKVIVLRQQGKNYREITEELGISKGTVAYHIGQGQKEKMKEWNRKRQEGICSKVHGFIYDKRKPYKPFVYTLGEIRKKARGFTYGVHALNRKKGTTYQMSKKLLKHPNQKVWAYIGKIFPGIKSEKEPIQALNQWTKQPDYEEGQPVRFPYMRCKLSGDLYNAKGNDVHADHMDGDRLNNSIENFSFISGVCNVMKGQMTYKQLYELICKVKINLEKYKEFWNGQEK